MRYYHLFALKNDIFYKFTVVSGNHIIHSAGNLHRPLLKAKTTILIQLIIFFRSLNRVDGSEKI